MKWNPFKRNKKLADKTSYPPDWVVERRRLARTLADKFSYTIVEGEPLPPWMEHPEILIGSIGWRMGAGEDFIHNVFFPFWRNMSQAQQTAYIKKFDLGSEWPDRDKWLASLEANKSPI